MFSQTLQSNMGSSAAPEDGVVVDIEKKGEEPNEWSLWVLNAPEPPGLWHDLVGSVSSIISQYQGNASSLRSQTGPKLVLSFLQAIFPILDWGRNYSVISFRNDLLAGLTIASLCIPQGIGYATLARLDPEYGLYTSAVPPLIYAIMGSSREVATGPVAVVSLLLSSMTQKLIDPSTDPLGYTKLVLTATLFAGIFQAAFGLMRLGFLLEFLSHAATVGFTAGAAIVIGLQQLKGLFGFQRFTNKTDVVSVTMSVHESLDLPWNYSNLVLGCSFLVFILVSRFLGKRKRKLFWLPAITPLASVMLSTLIVFLTRADVHGVNIIKHVKGGLNPSSVNQLELNSPYIARVAKIGLVAAVVALTESVSVGRSFASMRGYHLDGNKEMVSIGFMNIIGSFTSCYVAAGSFSRTAVNVAAGCETAGSNIVMAITVVISLLCFTKLLYFTPTAILASIIISALPGLVDFSEAFRIWKLDKLDFLACAGAFFGVLFFSVEIGLLVAVVISFSNIIMISIRPGTETLGRLPETDLFCDVHQYPMAVETAGVLIIRVKSALLCFANANFVRERIMKWVANEEAADENEGGTRRTIQLVIIDASNLVNIDTSGIASLEELYKSLVLQGKQLAIANPRWQVIHKLKAANFVRTIGGRVFLTVAEAAGCKLD
ncbi:sulfate transporter 2.1-like isoform X2 [Prosopis cineraria]|uniref:sulfate transporter 2.1-like isoform X2 n=1 Tax=Prosopis cineraria TaxID=364024 RepID=UPI002410386C|nr:sulfate transporter 2.1-like isoform X2 [Prosopis cineraria]